MSDKTQMRSDRSRGNGGTNFRRCLVLSWFVIAFPGFFGFTLFQNGWLRSPDLFQYFFDDFGNFDNLGKIWTRRPPDYYQNCSKIQETTESFFNIYYFHIWESMNMKMSEIDEKHLHRLFVCVFISFYSISYIKPSIYLENIFMKMRIGKW